MIYSDPDSSILSKEFKTWFEEMGIKSVITRQHAHIAERAIRTIKKRLDDKLEDDEKFPDQAPASYWTKHYQEAVDWYNSDHVQRTTNMTPENATKPEYEYDAKTNLEINAVHRRKYPEIEVGDKVRSFRKKVGEKERMGNFEEGHKTAKEITKSLGQTYYKLDEEEIPYTRADIHLIKKGGLPEGSKHLESFDKELEADAVSKDVNDRRNLRIDDDEREPEVPVGDTVGKIVERVSKMNKKDLAKQLILMDASGAKAKGAGPKRVEVGGSSGSGIPRDPAGRAL